MRAILQLWFRPPRLVLTLYFLLIAACASALAFLGWQVLEQDRAIDRQRHREHLESTASTIAASLQLLLAQGDVQLRVSPTQTILSPPHSLPFVPINTPLPPADLFAHPESLEAGGQPALPAWLTLTTHPDPLVRAHALVNAARLQRAARLDPSATYRRLEALGDTPVLGMPAALIARAALARDPATLAADLANGRYLINRETYDTYAALFPPKNPRNLPLAEAAAVAWQNRVTGNHALTVDGQVFLVNAASRDGEWTASITSPLTWQTALANAERRFSVHLLSPAPGAVTIAGLPVALAVSTPPGQAPNDSRRRLVLAALLVFVVLVAAVALFLGRAIARELAVARLQSDFVAAVSHEFRTPLTAIRHLTELLASGRISDPRQVQKSYTIMLGESDRLKRLIESVLDFGRIRSGTYQFNLEPVPINDFVRLVLDDFRTTSDSRSITFDFEPAAANDPVPIDRDALRGALWNLLDNSAKYAAAAPHVRVSVTTRPSSAEIRVEDHGPGIPKSEQRLIFDRFYRGAATRGSAAKGAGIGLALVKEVMNGHSGQVTLDSEPGRGAAFTLILPLEHQP